MGSIKEVIQENKLESEDKIRYQLCIEDEISPLLCFFFFIFQISCNKYLFLIKKINFCNKYLLKLGANMWFQYYLHALEKSTYRWSIFNKMNVSQEHVKKGTLSSII